MINLERRYLTYFDWITFFLICILSAISLLFVYSATYTAAAPFSLFFKKQALGILTGVIIYAIFSFIDYRILCRWGYFIYFIILGLLAFTLVKGSIGMGAKRWVTLLFVRFQPSELAKLFFPSFVTYFLYTQNHTPEYTPKDWSILISLLLISALLIMKQPDLGTAILIVLSGFTLLWLAGLSKKFFVIFFLSLILTMPLSWHFLKEYQKKRIAVFLGQGDNTKERYHIEQSKIAIGSGGILGKGFLQGTQNKLLFLPESRTDFIFSVICEEWGFLGALIVLLLYCCLFIRLLLQAMHLTTFFAQLLAVGLVIHIVYSMIINIGMVLGLLPIVGIPLPFMSYGISNMWVNFASLGWFSNITIRQQAH